MLYSRWFWRTTRYVYIIQKRSDQVATVKLSRVVKKIVYDVTGMFRGLQKIYKASELDFVDLHPAGTWSNTCPPTQPALWVALNSGLFFWIWTPTNRFFCKAIKNLTLLHTLPLNIAVLAVVPRAFAFPFLCDRTHEQCRCSLERTVSETTLAVYCKLWSNFYPDR